MLLIFWVCCGVLILVTCYAALASELIEMLQCVLFVGVIGVCVFVMLVAGPSVYLREIAAILLKIRLGF